MNLRGHKDLTSDPRFPFMVGRIVGACESTAILLQAGKLSAGELYETGVKLEEISNWFLDKETKSKPQFSEADTKVIRPSEK